MALSDVEISTMRSEIVQHAGQILHVTQVAVTATTAVIGFGLSRPAPQSALITLVPLLILWPSFSIVRNRRMNVLRIATYLRAFGSSSFQYERLLRNLRSYDKTTKWPSFHRAITSTFLMLGYISTVISFLLLIVEAEWAYLVVPIVAGLIWTLFAHNVKRSDPNILMGGRADDAMFKLWLEADTKAMEQGSALRQTNNADKA